MEITRFDSVVLLSKGYSIFSSSPHNAVKFFCSQVMAYEFKSDNNLVDFLLDIASGVERPTSQKIAYPPQETQKLFQATQYFTPPQSQPTSANSKFVSAFSSDLFFLWGYTSGLESLATSLHRVMIVLQRAFVMKFKDTETMKKSIFVPTLVGLVIGYLQFNHGSFGHYSLR